MKTLIDAGSRCACLAVLVLLAVLAVPVQAQPVHTLEIHGGRVYIDGQRVDDAQLPASLPVDDLDVRYHFSGDVSPLIELDGRAYRLEGGRLREVDDPGEEEDGVAVFFRGSMRDGGTVRLRVGDPVPDAAANLREDGSPLMREQTEQLEEQARALERLSEDLERRHLEQVDDVALQVRRRAEEAARMAQVLPRVEVQQYLQDVQRHNAALYEQLVRERTLEMETLRLAQQIQALPAGAPRDDRITELRRKLDTIFELKQENRRREIEALKQQLHALQERLQERERQHERIIEQRLQELLNAPPGENH